MVYVKSAVAGILVTLSGAILALTVITVLVRLRFHTPASFDVGLIRNHGVWAFLLLLFLGGWPTFCVTPVWVPHPSRFSKGG